MFNTRQLDTQATVIKYTYRTIPWQPAAVVLHPAVNAVDLPGSTGGQLDDLR